MTDEEFEKIREMVKSAMQTDNPPSNCELKEINPNMFAWVKKRLDMTDEEIDAMEAGREMDALVAEKVMGWIWCVQVCTASPNKQELGKLSRFLGHPDRYANWYRKWDGQTEMDIDIHEESAFLGYSTDIATAWQVVEKMRERRCLFTLHLMGVDWEAGDLKPNTWYAHFDFALHPSGCFSAEASAAPLAICRAALKCCKEPLQFKKEA